MSELELNMKYSTLEGYKIILKRLTEDKIELVRKWRNTPKISQYMEYRKLISAEEQLNWFRKINNDNNYYYLIVAEDMEVGLINVRDIDYQNKTGEPGIFIWDDDFLNSDISFRACALIMDFVFDVLELEKLVIHVLSDNKRAINFNKSWGFRLSDNQDGLYNQEYTLNREYYQKYKNRIIKYL